MSQPTTTVLTGRAIGVFRLSMLVSALKLEISGMKGRFNAYMILKRELGVKGNREKVLTVAEETLANVKNW